MPSQPPFAVTLKANEITEVMFHTIASLFANWEFSDYKTAVMTYFSPNIDFADYIWWLAVTNYQVQDIIARELGI